MPKSSSLGFSRGFAAVQTRFLVRAGVVVCLTAALVSVCSAAFAFRGEVSADRRTLTVVRESTDTTAQVTVSVYRASAASFIDLSGSGTADLAPSWWGTAVISRIGQVMLPGTWTSVEFPLGRGPHRWAVAIGATRYGGGLCVGGQGNLDYGSWDPAQSVDATVTSVPNPLPVSLSSTLPVSIDSTLPVNVASIGGFDSDGLTLAVCVGLVAIGGYIWRESL